MSDSRDIKYGDVTRKVDMQRATDQVSADMQSGFDRGLNMADAKRNLTPGEREVYDRGQRYSR